MRRRKKTKIEHANVVAAFAERLREIRRARGMTQTDVARDARLTETYISRLEAGGAAPGIDLVSRLAEALGCTIGDLVSLESPPDSLTVLRAQARRLLDAILKSDNPHLLSMVNQFLLLVSQDIARAQKP